MRQRNEIQSTSFWQTLSVDRCHSESRLSTSWIITVTLKWLLGNVWMLKYVYCLWCSPGLTCRLPQHSLQHVTFFYFTYIDAYTNIFMCKKDPVPCRLSVGKWHPQSWFTLQAMGGEAACWHSPTWARLEGGLSCPRSLIQRSHNPELFWTLSQSSIPHLPGMEIMVCYHTKPLSQPHEHILALHHGKSLWSFECYLGSIKIYPNKQLCITAKLLY